MILASLPVLLAIAFASVWHSQWGQLQLIKWNVARFSDGMTAPETRSQIARAYAMMGDLPGDFRLARVSARKMSSSADEAKTLALILEIWAKSKDPRLADEVSKDEE